LKPIQTDNVKEIKLDDVYDKRLFTVSRIEKLPDNISKYKIDLTYMNKAYINNIMSIIPNTIGSKLLLDSYKIIIPPGVSGNLMQ